MEMGDNTMPWKGTELKNSSCSKESDKSLGDGEALSGYTIKLAEHVAKACNGDYKKP